MTRILDALAAADPTAAGPLQIVCGDHPIPGDASVAAGAAIV